MKKFVKDFLVGCSVWFVILFGLGFVGCSLICFVLGLDGHTYYMGGDLDYGDCARPANTRIEVIRNYATPFKFGCWLSERLVPIEYKI